MAKIFTTQASDVALDWLVAKCEGFTPLYENAPHSNLRNSLGNIWHVNELNFSTDWGQAGPIMEREMICITDQEVNTKLYVAKCIKPFNHEEAKGETQIIAAMRCFVRMKLGPYVEVPDELLAQPAAKKHPKP